MLALQHQDPQPLYSMIRIVNIWSYTASCVYVWGVCLFVSVCVPLLSPKLQVSLCDETIWCNWSFAIKTLWLLIGKRKVNYRSGASQSSAKPGFMVVIAHVILYLWTKWWGQEGDIFGEISTRKPFLEAHRTKVLLCPFTRHNHVLRLVWYIKPHHLNHSNHYTLKRLDGNL